MVQAMINISEQANQIINIVKAKYNLNDKSAAIDLVMKEYGKELLEPELRPEYIEKLEKVQDEPRVKVSDFRKHFGLE